MPPAGSQDLSFPEPGPGPVDVLFVAGEHSGDQHAARLFQSWQALRSGLKGYALGGPALSAVGVEVLHDLTSNSVLGLVEVLRHYRYFRALMRETVRWIERHRPKVICLVDYPGFNLRLAGILRRKGISHRGGGRVRVCQYISPQIWAWKSGRRFAMAEVLDSLGVIFPFEVDCYADTGLPVRYVGHPMVDEGATAAVVHEPVTPEQGRILLLPGSRVQPVSRIFPVLRDAWKLASAALPGVSAVVPFPDLKVAETLRSLGAESLPRASLQPAGHPLAAGAALMSSGTMSLHCALAGIPGAIAYRAHELTYWIGRCLVRVPHLGIANLLLPETPPYPEFIQHAARPDRLAAELVGIVRNPEASRSMAEMARLLRAHLQVPSSESAAAWMDSEWGKSASR